MALVLPFLMLMAMGIWTTARAWNVHNVMDHAVREAVRYGATESPWDAGASPANLRAVADNEMATSAIPTGKVVGRYDVIIVEPNASSDFQGNKNLKQASAIVVWYGENAVCADGSGPFGSLSNPTGSQTSVKLVAGGG